MRGDTLLPPFYLDFLVSCKYEYAASREVMYTYIDM